jgi:hypothetical protein
VKIADGTDREYRRNQPNGNLNQIVPIRKRGQGELSDPSGQQWGCVPAKNHRGIEPLRNAVDGRVGL